MVIYITEALEEIGRHANTSLIDRDAQPGAALIPATGRRSIGTLTAAKNIAMGE